MKNNRHEEGEENPFNEKIFSDEPMLNKFGVAYQRRIESPRQHDLKVKIDLPELDGRIDPDEFINLLQAVERIFENKVVS